MRKSLHRIIARLPLSFRVLFRQFLLRVIDLEALSIEADIPRFLGQFAALLLFFSVFRAFGIIFLSLGPPPTPAQVLAAGWRMEEQSMAWMYLVAGLVSVLIWDATFPDRRDVLVLSPLPVRARTVLLARTTANCAVLALALGGLNVASVPVWSLLLCGRGSYLRTFASLWFALGGLCIFVYGSILTLQGLMALLLPRRIFLRLSAVLQIVAFGYFLCAFFLLPSLDTPARLAAAENHAAMAAAPAYWFFALAQQLCGNLHPEFQWLAVRAWIALLLALTGAVVSLLLCYRRILRKTVEEPDLQPGHGIPLRMPRVNSLSVALLAFSLRALVRSRQHRLALAVLVALVGSIALSVLQTQREAGKALPLNEAFLFPTLTMMAIAVSGMRSLFSLPISLTANWVLRITQLRSTRKYLGATRIVLTVLAILPVLLISALLGAGFQPAPHVAVHLVLLALVGWLVMEATLINFYKVPFTCSWLPGKASVQLIFCMMIFVFLILSFMAVQIEKPALDDGMKSLALIFVVLVADLALWALNRDRSSGAELYFEEVLEEPFTLLKISQTCNAAGREAAASS